MKLLLWTSEDPASEGIAKALVSAGRFGDGPVGAPYALDLSADAVLARVEGPIVTADFADRRVRAPEGAKFECALFLSRHSAASGLTSFTVHPIGNLGPEARVGGAPRTLAPPDPPAMTSLMLALSAEGAALAVPATFESTHHGPVMDIPSLFVEVGSTTADWENGTYCAAVARAVVSGYLQPAKGEVGAVFLGLGGGHYHPKHTDRARRDGTAIGHLVPAYALAGIEEATLRAAALQSRASAVLVDRRTEPDAVDRAARFLKSQGLSLVPLGA